MSETSNEWQVFSTVANQWCPVRDGRTAAGMRRDTPGIITGVRVREVGEWRNPEVSVS